MVTVTVLAFPHADDLDLFGTISVLAKASVALGRKSFFQVGSRDRRVSLSSGALVEFGDRWTSLKNAPPTDAVVIPGGPGISEASNDALVRDYLCRVSDQKGRFYAICTGAVLLAGAGLVGGRQVAMHHLKSELLADAGCASILHGFVRDGPLTTIGGDRASSCKSVDMALQLVSDFAPQVIGSIRERMELSAGRLLQRAVP